MMGKRLQHAPIRAHSGRACLCDLMGGRGGSKMQRFFFSRPHPGAARASSPTEPRECGATVRREGSGGGGVTVLCGFDAGAECGEMRRLCGRRERTADAGWWWEGGEGGMSHQRVKLCSTSTRLPPPWVQPGSREAEHSCTRTFVHASIRHQRVSPIIDRPWDVFMNESSFVAVSSPPSFSSTSLCFWEEPDQ